MTEHARYCPHALERLAPPNASQTELDAAYSLVRAVARPFGVDLPQARPTVPQVEALREERRIHEAKLDGVVGAWSADLAKFTAVVGAIRLAAVPLIDPGERLRMIETLLEHAPEIAPGDTSGVQLLIEEIKAGRMRAELVDHDPGAR